jgi:cell division protein FtsB
MTSVQRLGISLKRFLHRPHRVFFACLCFFVISSLFDGILWRLYGLHRDHERLNGQMVSLQSESRTLDRQLKQAKDPSFIERQARDRLDLAGENDLVFVFPED